VLNLRGIMVPIIDLRCRFSQGMTEATALHIVIVVQIGARHIGLLADRVLDIVGINASQVQPVPRIAQGSRADFLSGLVTIESGMIALIDLSHLLSVSAGDNGETGPAGQQAAA
jgi:purine-binding chemotaxis protein CheW